MNKQPFTKTAETLQNTAPAAVTETGIQKDQSTTMLAVSHVNSHRLPGWSWWKALLSRTGVTLGDAANIKGMFAQVMLDFGVRTCTFRRGGAEGSFSVVNFVPHATIKTFSSVSCVLSGLSLLLWLWV